MTRLRLPIDPAPASVRRRGGGSGEPASHPVPPAAVPLLLDSRQVAYLLGIGRTKAFELIRRGELPVVRIGRCVRVSRAALELWALDQNRQSTLGSVGHNRPARCASTGHFS